MTFDYSYTGNLSLLERPKVAFFASRVVPQVIHDQALEWAKQCCDTDRVVISGFHSPLENAVFHLLLEARHPIIWGLGRRLYHRYPPEVELALAENRIMIFAARNVQRTGWSTTDFVSCFRCLGSIRKELIPLFDTNTFLMGRAPSKRMMRSVTREFFAFSLIPSFLCSSVR